MLLLRHIAEAGGNIRRQDALEGVALAAGEDGGRHLVQLCRCQNEHEVGRGLLQNFQKGIEGGDGEHVDLVHNVDPLFHLGRRVNGLVPQGPDLLNAVIRGSVQLQDIQEAAAVNASAGLALVAGVTVYGVLAVHRLGQNFGAGGLSGAPGAGEEIGVGGPVLSHLPAQGLGDVALTDDVGKGLWSPLSI